MTRKWLNTINKSLHVAGVVIAAAKGIISHRNLGLLTEHGDIIDLEQKWPRSFLFRHGYVKRKVTKAARKLPQGFSDSLCFFNESRMK